MLQDNEVRLRHMLDAVVEALEFIEGKKREELDENRMLSHALVRLLEIVGEAATGVSDEFRRMHSGLPWKQMIGMRNRLIHGYFDMDLDILWQTVVSDLPALRKQLEAILEGMA